MIPNNSENALYLLGLLLSLVLLSGCVTTQATMLTSNEYPELDPSEVTIFLSFEDIPAEYEQIALLNAQGSSGMTNESQMYEAFRKRAAKIGANGVVLGGVNERGAGARIAGAIFGVPTQRRGEAVAIFVFYEDTSVVPDSTVGSGH